MWLIQENNVIQCQHHVVISINIPLKSICNIVKKLLNGNSEVYEIKKNCNFRVLSHPFFKNQYSNCRYISIISTVIKWGGRAHCTKLLLKIVERGTTDTSNTQIHDHSISWHGTGTSIESGGVKLVLWIHMLLIVWMLSQVINIQLLKFDTNKAHK